MTFEWLETSTRRRKAFRRARQIIRSGELDGPEHAEERAEMIRILSVMIQDPSLPQTDFLALAAVFVEMGVSNIRQARKTHRP